MDVRLTRTDCDEAGDYVVPDVLSLRDLVSRPDNMDETVLHTYIRKQRHQADQRLCFRSIDSTIPLLPKSEISSF